MRRINYITNLILKNQSGGWGGINYRMHSELSRHFHVNVCEGVNPPSDIFERIISKIRRVLRVRGDFFFFSKSRLDLIAAEVDVRNDVTADINFFFGATPWIHFRSSTPYAVYLDASFQTYLSIYSKPDDFVKSDIERICNEEAAWLRNATWIFWGSRWALNEAASQYKIDITERRHFVINTGGNIPIPNHIRPSDFTKLSLLFISLNFEKKGGFICYRAFEILRREFPMTTLTIIGEKPPDLVMKTQNVVYAGLLDKNKPDQLALLVEHLNTGSFLVHPTKMDTMGAVIVEAGYYGCPAIAPNQFGIPDLIKDGKTGFLIEQIDSKIIVDIITKVFQNKEYYNKLRNDCYEFYSTSLSWESIGQKIVLSINT